MRGVLLACAALALASPARAPDPARLEIIRHQILAKLGLQSRPRALGTPPRDVVRAILARAAPHPSAAPAPATAPYPDHRGVGGRGHAPEQPADLTEIIAIAHRDCQGSPTAPTFLSGHKYNYGVEGTVSIFLTGADKQETSVKLLGQVTVAATGNCNLELKVQNLAISGPDGKKYPAPPGIDKALKFTLEDGKLGATVFAEKGDTRRSLNIKRAIISLLQTENKPTTQTDVFGVCPTSISWSQEGAATLVHRARDLSRCALREHGRHDLPVGIYNPTAEIKNTQVLQSTLNVESKVNSGVPEKVSATEEYLYKPFSVGENGARAKVHTKLTLTGKAAGGNPPSQCTEQRSVIFEVPHGAPAASNLGAAVTAVKDTAKTLGAEASFKSAGEFAQLVRVLRAATKDDLMQLWGQVKGNNLEKRVFLDALVRTGTASSVAAAVHAVTSKELSDLEQHLVFLSLGNAKHVDNDALKAAASLLELPNLPKEIYLGVGALAGVFCRSHDCHHGGNDGIAALSGKLAAKVGNCKPKTKTDEDYVVAALKGVRNIRHLEDSVVDKLARCASDAGVKARVRVAALEAFVADPCTAKLKKAALELLKNVQLDSEIRIKSYLSVIACPCAGSATEIKNLLEHEPVHQVGRYISSSLRHIRSSSSPDRLSARHHYGQIRTPNRFNIDDRKYSFYRELSFNVDALGIGGSVEQSVIYSQDSFLPRSANLNLTAELFGHSLSVLEFGGRQGNLDLVAEHFLGPKSFLRTEKPQELYDSLVRKAQEAGKKTEGTLSRGRRSVKTEIDNFDKHLKAESTPFDNELDMDLYVKIFGTDAVFLSLGDDQGIDFNRILDKLLSVAGSGLDQVKHFQQELRAHLLFLDAELAYPTSTGLPLKLDLVGAATARVDVATNVDLRQIYRSPKNAKIDVKLVPSSDIQIAGLFLVDADAVSTGLKVVTNLHSSTGGHLVAKVLEDGRGFDLQFGLPVDKQEILTASNDLVYVTAERGQKEKQVALKVDSERKEYTGCFDQLSGLLGLTLCGEVSVPFSVSGPDAQASLSKFMARYPLTGSSRLNLVLEKADLRGYHVKGVLRTDNPEKQGFELLFEAEGSKNRHTSVSGELIRTKEEQSVSLSLESPIKTLYGQLAYKSNANERVAFIKAKVDAAEYLARAGFAVQGDERRSVYKPLIEYKLPDDQGQHSLKVDGQLVREVNGPATKYTFEGIKITVPNSQEVIDVNGHVTQEATGVELDLKATKGEHHVLVGGKLQGGDLQLQFQNTLNPYVNFKVKGTFDNRPEVYHNEVEAWYGPDLRSRTSHAALAQLLKYYRRGDGDFSVVSKNKFEISALPIKVKADLEVEPKKVDIELEGQYLDKRGEFDLEARTHIKKPGDYIIKVKAEVDKKGVELFAKRDIVSADKSNLENYVVVKSVGKYELSGVVLHKTKPNDLNVGAIGHLKISGGGNNEDIKFDIGAIENANLYSSHAKLAGSKGELLEYLLKITRGASPSGQLKFILKDTVAANGNFKVTDGDGKGHGLIIVDFKKSERKIKGDVKFVAKEPQFSADVDLFLNHEKDNNDKIHLSTHNKRTDKLIESKNKLEYLGKKTEVNVHVEGSVSGKSKADVEVVLPTERCLSFKLNRDVSVNDNVINGNVKYVLSDAIGRGGPASTVSVVAKITDTDYDKGAIDVEGQIDLKLKDGKGLKTTAYLKNVLEGDSKNKYDFKTEVSGDLIPQPASVSASGAVSGQHQQHSESYRLRAQYGDDVGLEYGGQLQVDYPDKGAGKYHDDSTLTLRLPFEKAHDLKLISNVMLLTPDADDVLAEFTIIEAIQINADVYKIDSSGKIGTAQGNSKVKVVVPHVEPFVLDANYKLDADGEKRKAGVELKAQYGKGKTAHVTAAAEGGPAGGGVTLLALAPQADKLKKLELHLTTKHPSPDTFGVTTSVTADDRHYSGDALVVYSKANPLLDLKYKTPESPQQSRIFVKGTYLSSTQGKLEVKVENVKEYSLAASTEANVQKDNVQIKVLANSEKLGWKNYAVDILSKDTGSGKRLEFHAANDGRNVFTGSTSFISKQEGPKTIVEGSGSVKVREEQKSANFKYIRTLLTEGNEQGVETFLNLAIGERSYVAESRVTNLEYKTSYVYCEEKKQCANAEIQSKLNVVKPGVLKHEINVGFDLRKLGLAPEFGLQVSNELSEKRLPQYTLDLHVNKGDNKYYLHAYTQPEHGKFPAGITITLPQRVLALETLVTYPTNKGLPFPIKGELALHLDKNKPGHKTAARFLVDVSGDQQAHAALVEFGFSHPKLGKEALVKFSGNVQRRSENSIKIETLALVSHPTLGNDRQGKILLEVDPVHFVFLVHSPLVKVIDLEGSATLKDNLQQAEVKFSLLESKTVEVRAKAKDFTYYEFTTGYTDESNKLSIIGHIEPEKRVDISADIVLHSDKKNILHGALYLQDNLVKSEYGISKDNFKYFVSALQKDLGTLESRLKHLGDKASADFKGILHKVEPTLKQLEQAYREDLEKLYKEVINDKTLKEISEALAHVVHFLAQLADDVVQHTRPIVDKIAQTISETSKKVLNLYETQIEPQIKQLYATVSGALKEYFEGLLDLAAHFAALVTDFFEKHKAELQELTNTFAEIFKDVTRLLVAQLRELRVRSTQLLTDLLQQLKDLPLVHLIKEKWVELAIPEQALGILQQAHTTWRGLLPTEETRNFADALFNYIQKKVRQEKVDEAAELRVMYEKLATAVTSLVTFVRAQLAQLGLNANLSWSNLPLVSTGGQIFSPSWSGAASFSLLSQVLKGDIPDPLSLIRAYRPRSFNPLDEVPNKLRAVIVNGQHIFTFDGRHLTFPGTCRYVLAHDHVDRNFTLVLQLSNGQPKALVLEDKSGDIVEIKDNGQVALNGANHGFPVVGKDIFAFKQPEQRIGLGSQYGIIVFASPKFEVIYVEVSGFYLGKLRGLLGDGNNEPFDDFRLPNGKISKSEGEFGNSYRLSSSCPAASPPPHPPHQLQAALPAACALALGGSSPLRALQLLLDAQPFRQACIHAVTSDPTNAVRQACDIAAGYTALAVTGLLPAALPPACVQCHDAGKVRGLGDVYEVRLPDKLADIVVAVETTQANEKTFKELAVPLLGQLVDQLKAKHITDIKVYLVGITSKMPYPILYDTDLKLKNAKVQFTDASRYEQSAQYTVSTPCEQLNAAQKWLAGLVDTVRVRLGLTNVVSAYNGVLRLPFRANALKHTINVVGEHCVPTDRVLEFFRALVLDKVFSNHAYTHTIVSPAQGLKIGSGKNPQQVVGYTEHSVLLLGDKKSGKDTESLRATLEADYDACTNFVESTKGLVVSSSNYHALDAGQKKQFLQTAAGAISHRMLGDQQTLECVCNYADPFRADSFCILKDRKDAPSKRK